MTRAAGIAIGVGALVVGTAVVISANRAQSLETREAKEAFTQQQVRAEQQSEALQAKVDREQNALKEQARLQQERIEVNADQQVDALKDKVESRQAQLDEYARAQEAKIDQNLAEAKTELNQREDALKQAEASPNTQQLSGTVTEVNPLTRTVAIQAAAANPAAVPSTPPATMRLTVGEDAAISMGSQRLPFSEVRVGDRVNVTLADRMGSRMVHSITISPRAATP